MELYAVSINESSNAAISASLDGKRLLQGCTVHRAERRVLGKRNDAELRESEHCEPCTHPTRNFAQLHTFLLLALAGS